MMKAMKAMHHTLTPTPLRTPWLLDNTIITLWGPVIGPYGGWIFRCLASHADNETGRCYPSIERIVAETGISRAQVKRSLKVLETCQLVTITRTPVAGSMPRRTVLTFALPLIMPTEIPTQYQHLAPKPSVKSFATQWQSEEGSTGTVNAMENEAKRVLPEPPWGFTQNLHGGSHRATELVLVENLSHPELVSGDDAVSADAETGAASATPPAAPDPFDFRLSTFDPPSPPKKLDPVEVAIAAELEKRGTLYLAHRQVILDADTYTPKLRRQNVLARIAEQTLTMPILCKYYPSPGGGLDWVTLVTLLGKAAGKQHGCGSALLVVDAIYAAQKAAGNPITAVLAATLQGARPARSPTSGRTPANAVVSTVFESDKIPD